MTSNRETTALQIKHAQLTDQLPDHMSGFKVYVSKIDLALSEYPLTTKSFLLSLQGDVAANPDLAKCMKSNFSSVVQSVMTAAQLGLRPGSTHSHFHLIPRDGVCTYMIGFRGYMDLIFRAGTALRQPQLVWKGEEFTYDRASGKIGHPMDLNDKINRSDVGNILGGYIFYRLRGSTEWQSYFMPRSAIDKRKEQSSIKSANGPWQKHFEAMAMKSIIKGLGGSGLVPLGDGAEYISQAERGAADSEVIHEAEFTETKSTETEQEHFDRLDNDPLPETQEQKETREEREAIQAEGAL